MRGVCAKSSYGRCPNPSPINPLPKSARNLPAPPPTSAIIPGSRRTGARSAGDPQRRRERMERAQPEAGSLSGVAGRGDARSSRVESRTAEGGGVDTRTGPGGGRCHPCPPCAEGPLANSEAHSPRMWKPVRAERLPSSKRYKSKLTGRRPGAPPTSPSPRPVRRAGRPRARRPRRIRPLRPLPGTGRAAAVPSPHTGPGTRSAWRDGRSCPPPDSGRRPRAWPRR